MEDRTYLSGTSLAGMSPTRSRVENDYYATPFEATEAILRREELQAPFWSLRLVKGISVRCFGNIIPTVKLSLLIWFREMIGSDVVLLAE